MNESPFPEPPRVVTFGRLTRRLPAFAVDQLLLGTIFQAFYWGLDAASNYGAASWTGSELWTVVFVGVSMPTYLYFSWMESSAWGATLGKRLFGLRVIDLDGQRIGFGRALGRTIVKCIPWEVVHYTICFPEPIDFTANEGMRKGILVAWILLFAYALTVAFRARRQAPHDLVAGTLVVIERGEQAPRSG